MKIEIRNAVIRLDNAEREYYSSYFHSPFNGFITVDFSQARVLYKIDEETRCCPWVDNVDLFKKILMKTSHKNKEQLYTSADIEGIFVMKKGGVIALIKKLRLKCTTEKLESETPWEKEYRVQIERLRDSFSNAKQIPLEELRKKFS